MSCILRQNHLVSDVTINSDMKWIKEIINPEPTDWSELDRLEQRIRDIRERIGKAKSAQESVFSAQRFLVQETNVERLKKQTADIRASLEKRSKVPEKPEERLSEAERIKAKLLGKKL